MRYRVEWIIDLEDSECDNVIDAAIKAKEMICDPEGTATLYRVTDRKENKRFLVDVLTETSEQIKS